MAPDASLSTVSSLPLPKADSADGPLPLMTSLPTPADGLLGPMPAGLSAAPAAGASTAMPLMDPAILGMSGAPTPVGALPGATVADTTVTAGVIMPTQLPGNSSKLQFGFGDTSACGSNGGVAAAAPAGAPGGLQKMPDFGLGQLSFELFDSNVSPLGAAPDRCPCPPRSRRPSHRRAPRHSKALTDPHGSNCRSFVWEQAMGHTTSMCER